MTAFENIQGIITSPEATFRKILKGDHRLIIPLDILIGIGVIRGIVDFLQRPRLMEILSSLGSVTTTEGAVGFQEQMLSQTSGLQNLSIFDAISSGVISAIFGWMFLVLVYFIISRIFGGKAGLKDLLEVIGYARVPELLGAMVALLLASVSPFFIIFLLLMFTLWARGLDILAIKEANDFSLGKAVATVVIPISLFLMFSVFTALLFLGI